MTAVGLTSLIQVLTHCDPRRAIRVVMLAESTPNVEVLCALNGDIESFRHRLNGQPIPDNVTLLPGPPKCTYPANALRNTALAHATAEWVFYIDADFILCRDFWPMLLRRRDELASVRGKLCLCPVALWDPYGKYLNDIQSPEFLNRETLFSHAPPRTWSEAGCAQLFKYHERYFKDPFRTSDRDMYEITDQMLRYRYRLTPPEPWGFLRREDAVWADEDFAEGPMDKQQFVSALLDQGVRFFVVPDAFMFHLWHPDARTARPDRARNMALWLKRHSAVPHHYLFVDIGGVLPPHLPMHLSTYVCAVLGEEGGHQSNQVSTATSAQMNVQQCFEAMNDGRRVIVAPCLSRALLGREYRVCVFFQSPAFYRNARRYQGGDRTYEGGDGSYIEWITGTGSLADAASRVENAALLCDVANVSSCFKGLQNLLGFSIPREWFREWIAARSGYEEKQELRYRRKYPLDYQFYDYMRIVGRSQ